MGNLNVNFSFCVNVIDNEMVIKWNMRKCTREKQIYTGILDVQQQILMCCVLGNDLIEGQIGIKSNMVKIMKMTL